MKTIIYLRKSTDEVDRQVQSLEQQLKVCNEIKKRYNLIPTGVIEESGSAKTAGKRPEFTKILKKIKEGEIDSIICWKPNRLARNGEEGGQLIDFVNNGKLAIYSENGKYEKGGSTTMLFMDFGFATQFSIDLGQDVTKGMNTKVEKGWRPGKAPLGYKNFGHTKGKKKIIIDKRTSPYVRRMFDLALAGKSVIDILGIITKEGLRIPATKGRSSRKLGKTQPYRLLSNPFYYGYFYWKGELRKGRHEAIVTKDEFDKVQRQISFRSKIQKENKKYWWLGLLKCDICGCAITTESKNRKLKDGTYRFHSYARCTKKKGPCNQKYVLVEDLEYQLKSFIKAKNLTPSEVELFKDEINKRNKQEFELAAFKQKKLRETQDRIFRDKKELMSLKLDGLITEQRFKDEMNKVIEEEQSLDYIDVSLAGWLADAEKVIDFAGKIEELFNNGDDETKRDIFRILGSDMILRDKSVWATHECLGR